MKVQRKGGSLFKNHPNICLVILRKITHTRSQIGDFRAQTLNRDLCIRSMTANTGSRSTVECAEFFYNHGPTRPPVVKFRRYDNANYRYYANALCGNSTRTQYILQCKHVGLDILKQQTYFYGLYGQFILRWKYIAGRRTASWREFLRKLYRLCKHWNRNGLHIKFAYIFLT